MVLFCNQPQPFCIVENTGQGGGERSTQRDLPILSLEFGFFVDSPRLLLHANDSYWFVESRHELGSRRSLPSACAIPSHHNRLVVYKNWAGRSEDRDSVHSFIRVVLESLLKCGLFFVALFSHDVHSHQHAVLQLAERSIVWYVSWESGPIVNSS